MAESVGSMIWLVLGGITAPAVAVVSAATTWLPLILLAAVVATIAIVALANR